MPLVMGLCDPVIVLDHGRKIAEGPPARSQPTPPSSTRTSAHELPRAPVRAARRLRAGRHPPRHRPRAREGHGDVLIGPNGAGKSTVLKVLSGLLVPARPASSARGRSQSAGSRRRGARATGSSTSPRTGASSRLMTIWDNLLMGGHSLARPGARHPPRRGDRRAVRARRRAPPRAGGRALGRPAEARRDRPRADARPEADPARRADDGPRREGAPPDLRDGDRAERGRPHHAARRAERTHRARDRPPRRRDRQRPPSRRPAPVCNLLDDPRVAQLYLGGAPE